MFNMMTISNSVLFVLRHVRLLGCIQYEPKCYVKFDYNIFMTSYLPKNHRYKLKNVKCYISVFMHIYICILMLKQSSPFARLYLLAAINLTITC